MSGLQQSKKRKPPFSMRLSDVERAALEAKAGSMSLSSYVKSVVLADDAPIYRKRRVMPEADKRLLAEILARLGQTRTSNNLNQIAKHLNQGTLVIDEEFVNGGVKLGHVAAQNWATLGLRGTRVMGSGQSAALSI